MSSGGTKSVVHEDQSQDNINCVLSGSKRIALIDRKFNVLLKNKRMGWWRIEDYASRQEGSEHGYGQFSKGVDVDAVDLLKYPGWSTVPWFEANVSAGDCLLIPSDWFHQVGAFLFFYGSTTAPTYS